MNTKIRILFVCLGNICRSPAAEGVMLHVLEDKPDAGRWTVDSCGTGDYHIGDLPDHRMREHARRRGLNLTHICRQIRREDFRNFDLIIGMDAMNIANLRRIAPDEASERKIVCISDFFPAESEYDVVPDPYYSGPEAFETVLDLLEDACANIYARLSGR